MCVCVCVCVYVREGGDRAGPSEQRRKDGQHDVLIIEYRSCICCGSCTCKIH